MLSQFEPHPVNKAMIAAAVEKGYPHRDDFNAEAQTVKALVQALEMCREIGAAKALDEWAGSAPRAGGGRTCRHAQARRF